ncbi:DUF4747 family protein (plasmid) [Ralstonia solanacearum P673]|uniref:DUF4747 family protein n=1 Tax=Ralstonia solanacearum TaxID=305 RepID=UPI002029DD06|nr:DUF4747 family protein [Ralstonia solanacearum]MCL9850644.1 DUF4747 family protein [Ralstonia solanacearum]MCL9856627.1 DUF4747 family protein [Ralstonia solanacearum]MCL9861383.1 DUF4747 family protein [Ralstonia solanacearum]MCL9866270.1 DUF4747 family protein [Ralstonia solanacearum]MCL9870998.1 DUF4747 family protein [Ralstonia solanacearum]
MARKRHFSVSGINIRVHGRGHYSRNYVELWKMFWGQRKYVIHANTALMIGDVRFEDESNPESPIYGYLYRFLDIGRDEPWFDIEQHKQADPGDVSQIKIPEKLKASLKEIPYFFDVKKHKLYFVRKEMETGVSPWMVLKLIQRLGEARIVVEKFGKVDATILTDQSRLEELYRWQVIKTLEISIERPNPTDYDDEQEVFRRMKARGVSEEKFGYKKAPDAETIVPDDEMKAIVTVGADNGVVRAKGIELTGRPVELSSKDIPRIERSQYDHNTTTLMDSFKSFVYQGFKRFMNE